ncbi:MAG: glycosyltransferase family 4 protein [Pirellulales bacterium]
MPEVVLLCEHATLNGGERSALAALPGLQAEGFEIVALAPPSGPLASALTQQGVEVIGFEAGSHAGSRSWRSVLRQRLVHLLGARRPALVHANSLSMARLAGPVAAELGLPSLAHLRDIVRLSRPGVEQLNAHGRLLAVSQATRDYHLAQGLSAEKTFVLHNGVDLQRFQPRRPTGWLHARLGLPPQAVLVGTIGQLVMRKGHDVLALAAAMLSDVPHLHWVIAGSRYSGKEEAVRYEAQLHATFAAAGLSRRVHFLGTVDYVAELLNELTLLIHPARQEPLGRVLLEASAAGLPMVASDVGGTREIVAAESWPACLVRPGDPRALALAARRLLDDPQRRRVLGESNRRQAEAVFDVRRTTAALAQHYRELCD